MNHSNNSFLFKQLFGNICVIDLLVLFFQILILVCISLPNGLKTTVCPAGSDANLHLSILCPADEAIVKIGHLADSASYIIGGQKFLSGWLHGSDNWFLACWPPGFFLLQALFFKIFGLNCPILLCLSLTTAICWGVALWGLYLSFRQWQSRPLSLILSMSLCFTQLFDQFFLNSGITLSESLSTAFLVFSLLFALQPTNNKFKNWSSFMSAACLAGAAYLRAQVELFSVCLLALILLFVVIWLVVSTNYRKLIASKNLKQIFAIPLHSFLLIAIMAQIIMLPYRVHNYIHFGNAAWLRADYIWQSMWMSDSTTLKNGAGFTLSGGINVPAKLNPQLSKEIESNLSKFGKQYYPANFYKHAAIETFLKNPVKWIFLKSSYLPYGWFDGTCRAFDQVWQIENWFYAILFWIVLVIATIRVSTFISDFHRNNILDLFFINTVLTQSICSIFLHLEPRYFYFLKIMSVITASFYIAEYFQSQQRKAAVHQPNTNVETLKVST